MHIFFYSSIDQSTSDEKRNKTSIFDCVHPGLDPAGPLFYTKPPELRIDKTDALFVDILHTNSGSILEVGHGWINSLLSVVKLSDS